MAQAERLLNQMENAKYKSPEYYACKRCLTEHLLQKREIQEDAFAVVDEFSTAWEMTGPSSPTGLAPLY